MKEKNMTEEQRQEIRDYIEIRVNALNQTHDGLIRSVQLSVSELRNDIKPMVEMFSNIKWGERVLIRIGVFLAGTVTVVFGILQIIKALINFKK